MLFDIKLLTDDPINKMIAEVNGNPTTITQLKPGAFLNGGFNFNNHIDYPFRFCDFDNFTKHDMEYPTDIGINCYGVCDSVDQVLEQSTIAHDPDRYFIVGLTEVRKQNQSPDGGWRWHKWGPYIGVHTPTTEYLYDEPDIDVVYVYHIYEYTPAMVELHNQLLNRIDGSPSEPILDENGSETNTILILAAS